MGPNHLLNGGFIISPKDLLKAIKIELKRIIDLFYYKIYLNPKLEKDVVAQFCNLYFNAGKFGKTWADTLWLGTIAYKCPLDLWIYQEIIYELKPDIIIETGTFYGGSALFLASMCDLIDNGEVVTIDIEEKRNRPQHKRIKYIIGSSVASEVTELIKNLIKNKERIMVILDSDHRKEHVLKELKIYSDFVTNGSYLIVEDTNIGHPVEPNYGPGPREAVLEFLTENKNFIADKAREKFYLTFNPNGYLKRIK